MHGLHFGMQFQEGDDGELYVVSEGVADDE